MLLSAAVSLSLSLFVKIALREYRSNVTSQRLLLICTRREAERERALGFRRASLSEDVCIKFHVPFCRARKDTLAFATRSIGNTLQLPSRKVGG